MNGTELTERLVKDLEYGITKQTSVGGETGKFGLIVISQHLRVIVETINSSSQLIDYDQIDLTKALEDIKQHQTEVANRFDTVIENGNLVSITDLKTPVRELLIKELDTLNKTYGVKP